MTGRLLLAMVVPERGGAEEYALTIGHAAITRGWSVHAVLPLAPGTETLARDLVAAGIGLSPIPKVDGVASDGSAFSTPAKLRAAARFTRITRQFHPDVVHIVLPWPTFAYPYVMTTALLALPTLLTFQLVPDAGLLVRGRRRLMYAWARARAQRWIAVSDHGRRLVGDLFRMDAAQIGVIHNGVPADRGRLSHFARRTSDTSVRTELGIETDASILLAVGRLHPQKGHADLVCAAAGVCAERPDVRVLIAGEGPERERLEELVRALGLGRVVQLLGHRSDTGRLMDAADLLVFPSHYEGTPFAMLEAMARGLPVITAAYGGAEEIVDDDRTGMVVPVGRPDALRIAILKALADPQRLAHLGAAGRERAACFSQEAMIAATFDELERLCSC